MTHDSLCYINILTYLLTYLLTLLKHTVYTTPIAVMICHLCCKLRLRRSVQKAFHAWALWLANYNELPKAFCYKADKNSTCQLQCSQWSHAVRRLSCVEERANNSPDLATAPLVIWRRKRERGRRSKPPSDQQMRRRLCYVSEAATDQLRLLPASEKRKNTHIGLDCFGLKL